MQGKIMKGVGGFYYIHPHNTVNTIYECKAKGAFRNQKIKPAVGDDVEIEIISEQDKTGNIVEILPRENLLIRPAVANVDQAVIVFALADPKPNYNLLDRFLIMMEQQGVDTLICFNKSDLVSGQEAKEICDIYAGAGYQVFLTVAKENVGVDAFREAIRGKTSVFAGPSGVGKSSMLNALHPQAQVQTGAVSEKIRRGKHTTRHSELIYIEEDTYIMDTPGFSSLVIEDLEPEDLKEYFREFECYNGRCKFNGCVHIHEPECFVKEALQAGTISQLRYDNYMQLYDELKNKYCLDNGRNAKNPILLFKYLLLKYLYNLSDNGVVERSRYDMSFKYFLELTPEEEVIHPSLLTKFRKQRLKDENILDLLINKSVELAINQGVLKSNTIIVDSTHTEARYHKTTQREMLKKASTSLKVALKDSDKDIYLPDEPEKRASLDEYNEYCHELLNTVQESPYSELPTIKEESSMLSEILDNQIDCYDQSIDPDARIGHKTVNSSFYGYKTHLAMTDERIITAATITSGEAFDGQELPVLVQKSKAAGATVNEVIADTAYSTLENLKDAQSNDYKLISKLNPSIIKGTRSEDGFIFNKDADTMQCPAGHLAIKYRIDKRSNQKKNTRIKYFFDINKCHVCPYRNGCYKENAKTKTYSITIKSDYHKNQEAFQKTQYFKERFKTRYMIEAKNSELKNIHGYSRCDAAGLSNMQLQGAVFAVNLKRILKLKGEVCPNEKK